MKDLCAAAGNYAKIAREVDLPKQFLYDLRDGKCRSANQEGDRLSASQDERYAKIDALCQKHGITDFLAVAIRTQNAWIANVNPNYVAAQDAFRSFEDSLVVLGLHDKQLDELCVQIYKRIRELRHQ